VESLDHVRAIFRDAPFIADLGIEPLSMGAGRCETELAIQPRMLQRTGQVHAGVVTTLADHTAGAAAQSVMPAGSIAITAELKLSLLRPARGERLACSAVVLKAGRSLVFAESEVYALEGGARTLVAKLSATLAVTGPA